VYIITMKITIKTLKNKKYELEVKEDDSVAAIKEQIHTKLEFGPPELQNLIHHGKILKDDQTAKSAGFKENDFVVLMIRKQRKRKQAAATTAPASSAPAAAPAATAASGGAPAAQPAAAPAADASNAGASGNAAAAAPAAASTSAPADAGSSESGGPNSFAMGTELQRSVQHLVSMGFPEADVQRCMRAAFNNPDRAAEYLLNGIPPHAARAAPGPAAAAPAAASGNATNPAAAAATGTGPASSALPAANPGLAASMAAMGANGNPSIDQLRNAIMSNPQALAAMVSTLAASNPQLRDVLSNPATVQKLLNDPNVMRALMLQMIGAGGDPAGRGGGGVNPMAAMLSGMGRGRGGPAAAAAAPPQNVIRLSPDDAAAIARLSAMGFTREQAYESYTVSGKNEMLAANYLFDNFSGSLGGGGGGGGMEVDEDQSAPAAAAPAAPEPAAAAPAAADAPAPNAPPAADAPQAEPVVGNNDVSMEEQNDANNTNNEN